MLKFIIGIIFIVFKVYIIKNYFILLLQVLQNNMVGFSLHEAAADSISTVLQVLEEDVTLNRDSSGISDIQLQQLQLNLFSQIINLEQPYNLSVAHEDMDKCVTLFSNFFII